MSLHATETGFDSVSVGCLWPEFYLYLIFACPDRQQKVVLKTSSTSPVKLQLLIEGNHSDFQVCVIVLNANLYWSNLQ